MAKKKDTKPKAQKKAQKATPAAPEVKAFDKDRYSGEGMSRLRERLADIKLCLDDDVTALQFSDWLTEDYSEDPLCVFHGDLVRTMIGLRTAEKAPDIETFAKALRKLHESPLYEQWLNGLYRLSHVAPNVLGPTLGITIRMGGVDLSFLQQDDLFQDTLDIDYMESMLEKNSSSGGTGVKGILEGVRVIRANFPILSTVRIDPCRNATDLAFALTLLKAGSFSMLHLSADRSWTNQQGFTSIGDAFTKLAAKEEILPTLRTLWLNWDVSSVTNHAENRTLLGRLANCGALPNLNVVRLGTDLEEALKKEVMEHHGLLVLAHDHSPMVANRHVAQVYLTGEGGRKALDVKAPVKLPPGVIAPKKSKAPKGQTRKKKS